MPTVDPPTKTGSNFAKGVACPPGPIETSMSMRRVVLSSGGSLYAIAQRGALAVEPNFCCVAKSSTLTTTPSIS